jgi:hypothetical protein
MADIRSSVIPAKAGTQYAATSGLHGYACVYWIPAFAGMTGVGGASLAEALHLVS